MPEMSEENMKIAQELGYSPEQAKDIVEKAGQVIPTLQIPDVPAGDKEGQKIPIEFDSDEVKTIQTTGPDPKDKTKTVKKDATVTTVLSEDGIRHTLWLTSESMKRAYLQLRSLHKDGIKGVKAVVYKAKVNYPQFGEGIAYRIQEITGDAAAKISQDNKVEAAADAVPAEPAVPAPEEKPAEKPEDKPAEAPEPEKAAPAEKKDDENFF